MVLSERLAAVEAAHGPLKAMAGHYANGHLVVPHEHSRAQLLYVVHGIAMVSTEIGRWMVPPEHAMWIPAGIRHSVDMLGDVEMRSLYIDPAVTGRSRSRLIVLGMSDLMRALIALVIDEPDEGTDRRRALAVDLLMAELPCLAERPLALPLPANARLAWLCRAFVTEPSARATIDLWAQEMGMSRRTFTRFFLRETGLGLSTWRQQASLFAALPRLADGEAVTSVAIDLGYSSVPAFTTMFTRMLGVSPRAYFRRAAN